MPRKRELKSPSRVTTRGFGNSDKSIEPIRTESHGEANFVLLAEFTSDIVYIKTQPETFRIEGLGKTFTYTPDLLIARVNGESQYIEIKDERYLRKPEYVEKVQKVKEFFRRNELELRLYTDAMLLADRTLLANLEHLRRYRSPVLRRLVPFDATLPTPLPTTLGGLKAALGAQVSYRLIAEEKVWCDLRTRLDDSTPIYLMEGKQHAFID